MTEFFDIRFLRHEGVFTSLLQFALLEVCITKSALMLRTPYPPTDTPTADEQVLTTESRSSLGSRRMLSYSTLFSGRRDIITADPAEFSDIRREKPSPFHTEDTTEGEECLGDEEYVLMRPRMMMRNMAMRIGRVLHRYGKDYLLTVKTMKPGEPYFLEG